MLKFWSKTQAVVALSSAEAELGAAVKASQEVLRTMSLWKDVGETTRGHVMGDASAAIGIIRRMGLGKVRHLKTSSLWVQEKEASRELQCHKVKSSDHCADLFTKALDHDTEAMGCEFMFGRDPVAFTVNNLSAKVSMETMAIEIGEPVQDKRKNGCVDKNGLAPQNLQDHKQGRTDLERRWVQSDEEWRHHQHRRRDENQS